MNRNQAIDAETLLASVSTRVLAGFIDLVLVMSIQLGVSVALYRALGIPLNTTFHPVDIPAYLLVDLPYYVGCWYWLGGTPGKLALGIRVVDAWSGGRPPLQRLLLRYLGYWVSTVALFLGFIAMRKHPRRQTWHDRWAKTVVVELPLPVLEQAPESEAVRVEAEFRTWQRILFTAVVLVLAGLAIAGGVVGLWSPPALPPRAQNDAIAQVLFRLFRVLVPVTQIGGGLAAVVLVTRSGKHRAARMLALTLAAYWASRRVLILLGIPEAWSTAISISMDWIAIGALLRFIALFPRPMPSTVWAIRPGQVSAFARLQIVIGSAIDRMFNRGRGTRTADVNSWTDRLSLDPRVIWSIVIIVSTVTMFNFGTRNGDGPVWLSVVRAVVFFALIVQALRLLKLRYRSADTDQDEKRLLWLVNGVYSGLVLPFVVFAAVIVFAIAVGATGGITGTREEVRWIVQAAAFNSGIVAARVPSILLTGFLIFAVFYKGALDPNLTIRKTTVYGALAVLAMVLFAGFEYLISSRLSSVLKMSDGTSNVLAGVLAAAVVAPVQGRVRRKTDRLFDRFLPARPTGEREVALVCSDLADAVDDETVVSLFQKEARAAARRRHGRLSKTIGDAVLLEFNEASAAMAAATELEDRFSSACDVYGLARPALRTAVHYGLVGSDTSGEVSGDAVNLVARLQLSAKSSDIVVSKAVADRSDVKTAFPLEKAGSVELRNQQQVVTYRIVRRTLA